MMFVLTCFVNDVQRNQQATGEANGHPKDVDEGKKLVVSDVAPGDFQVVFQHGRRLCITISIVFLAGILIN